MEAVAEQLDAKLHLWEARTSEQVRVLVAEIIARADEGTLDLARSRSAEQEVLDLLDHAPTAW